MEQLISPPPFSSSHWLLNISEIKLGHSAILGGNYTWFYIIHMVAVSLIVASLTSCAIVIGCIIKGCGKKMDFADRFPLYLAVADLLWGISHLMDHIFLLATHTYPSSHTLSVLLSINIWTFLGYQQLMHAGLALYTYVRVVRGRTLNMGRGEWKLHVVCATIILISILVFLPLDSFGPSGFWMLCDVRTSQGIALGIYVAFSAAAQALCTSLGYRSIKRVVQRQKEAMLRHYQDKTKASKTDANSTASECLTTFVLISLCLYCPLALIFFLAMVQAYFGVIEPITALLIVITANSSGWANALGYFHNRRIKERRNNNKGGHSFIPSTNSTGNSTSSANSNTHLQK